jgi:ketosteroid isomerase-like protein
VTREHVDRWLADYVEAWKTYDRGQIAALFTEDVSYRYHPSDDPIEGRDEVIKAWRAEGDHPEAGTRDEPGTYEASYRAVAVDGDVAVATGQSSYRDSPDGPVARIYDNCFVMRFDSDGRCREFTEWFMQSKDS